MTRPARTIDLGELPHHGQPPPDDRCAGRSTRWRHARWRHARWWRPWLGAAAAAVLLAAVHADAPPEPSWAELQFRVAGEPFHLGQDTLYTVRAVEPGRQSLAAYRLEDGARLWETTRDSGDRSTTQPDGRVVIHSRRLAVEGGFPLYVSTRQARDDDTLRDRSASTTALDPSTGRPLWTRSGWPIGTPSGDVLVLEQPSRTGSAPRAKTGVHLPTGETAWSTQKEPGSTHQQGDRLVARDLDGGLTFYDVGTGARLATGTAPVSVYGIHVVDDLVLMWTRTTQHWELIAHEADTLAVRWTAPVPPDSIVGECHTVVCVHSPQGVAALDPATGERRWAVEWPTRGEGRRMVRELSPPWPQEHLLLHSFDTVTLTGYAWIRDAHTGAVVADLDAWRPSLGGGPDALLTRSTSTGRTWFGRFLQDPPGVQIHGWLDGVSACHAAGHHLACQAGSTVEVWRIQR